MKRAMTIEGEVASLRRHLGAAQAAVGMHEGNCSFLRGELAEAQHTIVAQQRDLSDWDEQFRTQLGFDNPLSAPYDLHAAAPTTLQHPEP